MSLETLLQTWGLPAVTLGAAVEGEGAGFMAGVMAHRHVFTYQAAVFAVWIGAFLGDEALFLIGRQSGRWPRVQRLMQRGPAARVQRLIRERPVLLIFGFRFVYGMRYVGALSIGAAGVRWRRFLPLNAVSVLVWANLVVLLGYGLGASLRGLFGHLPLHHHLILALIATLAILALVFSIYRLRRRG